MKTPVPRYENTHPQQGQQRAESPNETRHAPAHGEAAEKASAKPQTGNTGCSARSQQVAYRPDASAPTLTARSVLATSRQRRGATCFMINDQAAGLGGKLVAGTPRHSPYVLDVFYYRDGGQQL